jgi:hypothetical protein
MTRLTNLRRKPRINTTQQEFRRRVPANHANSRENWLCHSYPLHSRLFASFAGKICLLYAYRNAHGYSLQRRLFVCSALWYSAARADSTAATDARTAAVT